MALTPKQSRFVEEYLVDLNATQAAIRAGYSPHTADVIGHENLGKPEIAMALAERRRLLSERTDVNAERVIRELARVAFGRLDEVAPWDEQGPRLIASSELPEHARALVASIRVKRERPLRGSGENAVPWEVETIEVKPWDKLGALEKLGKHLGLFTDRVEASGELTVRVVRE